MEVLLVIADTLNPGLGGHLQRVSQTAVAVASELLLADDEIERIRRAALYHDIGKLTWPDHLRQGAPRNEEDREIIRRHPIVGAEMLQLSDHLADLYPLVLHHHERYDGDGLPDGLSGNDIPIGARIISVCDVADAITSERNYDPARPQEEMLTILDQVAGRQLDPDVVAAYLRLFS